MESGGAAMAFLLWDKKYPFFVVKARKYRVFERKIREK